MDASRKCDPKGSRQSRRNVCACKIIIGLAGALTEISSDAGSHALINPGINLGKKKDLNPHLGKAGWGLDFWPRPRCEGDPISIPMTLKYSSSYLHSEESNGAVLNMRTRQSRASVFEIGF